MSDLEVFSKSQLIPSEPSVLAQPRTAASGAESRIAWTLHRSQDSARCVLRAVGDRVQLHITMTHEVVMSQQCSGPDQAAAISSAWWLALVNRGWIGDRATVTIKAKSRSPCGCKAPRRASPNPVTRNRRRHR
jgi:hypothetical protein